VHDIKKGNCKQYLTSDYEFILKKGFAECWGTNLVCKLASLNTETPKNATQT